MRLRGPTLGLAALLLAQTVRALPLPRSGDERPVPNEPIDRLVSVVPALRACWHPPLGLAKLEHLEVTARLALRTDGSLIGDPAITFATGTIDTRSREMLTRSVVGAIRACTPLRMSSGLASSIAGRPLSIRFIYVGRKGLGV